MLSLAEDQKYIRDQLPKLNLCAFVADGSVLPRESGVSSRPMRQAVAFHSPDSLKVTLNLPYHGPLSGMGIPKGITLIVGGGYHGKSTLLKALELGVYNHRRNDGREYVITDDTAVKLRAEDGRSIKNTDISLFINNLPNGKDTVSFSTEDASGSTSQAANVIESMEAGTSLFLIDEDTSATNFMIRDELMQRVVHRIMSLSHRLSSGSGACMKTTVFLPSSWREAPGPISRLPTTFYRWTVICQRKLQTLQKRSPKPFRR